MSNNVLINANSVATPGTQLTATSTTTPLATERVRIHTIVCSICGDGTNASGPILFVLRNGASGVGTILWSCLLSSPAIGGTSVVAAGLDIRASSAPTLEMTTAPGGTIKGTVHASGELIPVGIPSYSISTL